MSIGYEFQPDEEKRLRNNLNQPGQFNPGVSEAIKVLSLRLPQVLGGSPMAPDDLLRPGVGGAGGQLGSVGQSVLNASGGGPGGPALPPETAGAGGAMGGLRPPGQQPFSMMRPGGGETGQLNELMGNALQPGKPHIYGQNDPPNLGSSPPQGASGPGIPNPSPGQGITDPPDRTLPGAPQPGAGGSNSLHDILEFLLQRQPDGGRRV